MGYEQENIVAETTQDVSADEVVDTVSAVKTKKKFPLQTPTIIAACIVLLALCVLFVVTIMTPTIEGTWQYVDEQGINYYYTFEETPDGNVLQMSIGTIYYNTSYETNIGETSSTVSIVAYNSYINGDYTYAIEGNNLSNKRVLTLTDANGNVFILNETEKPQDSDYIMPDENFKKVDKLVGEYEAYDYYYIYKLSINDDGTMIMSVNDIQELHFVYTVDDSIINLTFFDTDTITQQLEYSFEGDDLVFMGNKWTRVNEASLDETK